MRVLFTIPKSLSDASRVYEEAKTLIQNDHEVTFITWDYYGIDTQKKWNSINVIPISKFKIMKSIPFPFLWQFLWRIKAYKIALQINIKKPFDIIHCVDIGSLPLGVRLKKKLGIPLIYEARELFFDYMAPRIVLINNIIIEKFFLSDVSRIICPNELRSKAYAKYHNLKNIPFVIRNVTNNIKIKSNQDLKKYIQPYFDNLKNKKLLLYIGGIIPERGLKKAIIESKKFDKNIIFVLVGPTYHNYDEKLKHLVEKHSLNNRVIILPKVSREKALKFMNSTDAALIIYENVSLNNYLCSPRKMWELVQTNTPIIGCNLPEISKMIQKYKIGLKFDLKKSGSLAKAVNNLLNNFSLINNIKKNVKKVSRIYCWEKESEKLLHLYENLVK